MSLLTLLSPGTGRRSSLFNGLVSYWNMEEPSGSRSDLSGNANTLADVNTVTQAVGKMGSAAQFTGANSEYLNIASNPLLAFGDTDYTLCGWVWFDSLPAALDYASIITKDDAGANREYILQYGTPSKRLEFVVRGAAGWVANLQSGWPSGMTGFFATGRWYFVTVWHDATNNLVGLGVNALWTRAATSGPAVAASAPFRLGANGAAAKLMDGRIDEVGIWNRRLTDLEIDDLWNESTGLAYPFTGARRPKNAGWCWFADPRALYFSGTHQRTYIGYTNSVGDVRVAQYDHANASMAATTLYPALIVNDHSNPTLLVRDSDHKLLVWYGGHGSLYLFQQLSVDAESALCWNAATDLDASLGQTQYSYPNPVQLTGEANNPIYLFYRALGANGQETPCFSKSSDEGATWAAGSQLFIPPEGAVKPYFKVAQNGTARIDVTLTDGDPALATNSLYHIYYQGAKWYQSDGTEITAALPFTGPDCTMVHDGAVDGRCWVWDIAIDATGNPVIVYSTFPDATTDHRYRYAIWDGATWHTYEICQAGGPLYADQRYYSGGISLDHDDVNSVYCSREIGGQWQIWHYVTANGGQTWTGTAVTQASDSKQMRPVVPRNSDAGLKLLWLGGRYTTYIDYDLTLLSTPQY